MTEMIENFAGAYLFEEYDEEYDSFEGALVAFLDDLSPKLRDQLSDELKKILADNPTNETIEAALEELGWTETTEDGNTRELVNYTLEITLDYIRIDKS